MPKEVDRINRLIETLINYARPPRGQKERILIGDLIEDCVCLAYVSAKKEIVLQCEVSARAYVYGNKDMYAVLAAVVGMAQLLALVIFQSFSKRMPREKLYLLATILVMIGYAIFFFAEVSIILIAVGALFIFIGQAFIQLLMLMFLEDTIEYGQWKNGKRSESITLSVQPLINKIGGAVSMGITSLMLVWSGIKVGETAAESISASGQFTVKLMMIVLPVVFILAGYIIYRCKFKINKEMYDRIISDLRVRGELHAEPADVVEVTETVEVKITKE